MLLNWEDDPNSGWATNYTITIIPRKNKSKRKRNKSANVDTDEELLNRTRREGENGTEVKRIVITTTRPPVNISELLPESKYKIIIETELGTMWRTRLVVDEVVTTANDSVSPEEIIGVSIMRSDENLNTLALYLSRLSERAETCK